MSRLDHEANQWLCKIVLFGPPTENATQLAQRLIASLPAGEHESLWETPQANAPTLVARYRPAATSLVDMKPVYSIHALRKAESSATERQHLLSDVDGVVLLLDSDNLEASRFAERELERFLGMFGKMIATMPTVLLASATLDDAQQTALNPGNQSLFDASNANSLGRAIATLTSLLEEDSGLAGLGLNLDELGSVDDGDGDDDDIEFEDIDLADFVDDDE